MSDAPLGFILGWEEAGTVRPLLEPYSDYLEVYPSIESAATARDTTYRGYSGVEIYALEKISNDGA